MAVSLIIVASACTPTGVTAHPASAVQRSQSGCGHRTGSGGATGPPGATPATRPDRSWSVSKVLPGAGFPEFTAVSVTSPASAWAFSAHEEGAARPAAWRLSGSVWTRATFPGRGGEQVTAARSSSPSNVWAFTSAHRAFRWNGCSWAVVRGFPGRNVSGAAVISSQDVWVFGQRYAPGGGNHGTWHYNGHAWTRVPLAAGLAEASAVSASDIWAFGASWSSSATVIAHWNGSGWQRSSVAALLPRPTPYCGPAINGIYGVSATQAWAVGSALCQDVPGPSVLLHYTGGTWHVAARLGDHVPLTILPDGRGGLWIPVNGAQIPHCAILHYSHGTLTAARLPFPPQQLLLLDAAPGSHGIVAFAAGRRTLRPSLATTAVILSYRI